MVNNQQVTEKKPTERVVEYVREKAAGINWTPIILYGGAIFLGYEVLKSQGLIKTEPPTSTAVTPECPRGAKYTRGLFGDCDPNYVMNPWENFWAGGTCQCLGSGGGGGVPVSLHEEAPYKRHPEYYPGIPPGSHPPLPVSATRNLPYKRPIPGLPQEGYTHNWAGDREQLSLDKWTPLSKEQKLKLGIVSK